jgi:hypothetical protein
VEIFIRASCFLCLDFTRVHLKSDFVEEIDSEEEEEEYQRQLQMQEEEAMLLKNKENVVTPLMIVSALKSSKARYGDEEEGFLEDDTVKHVGRRGTPRTPGVGNDEFFDESAPLKANAARRTADETWGDLRTGD